MPQRWIAAVGVVVVINAVVAVAAWQARDAGTQTPVAAPKGSGVLAGQVLTDTANPQPARRATVKLEGGLGTSNRLAGTDDDGRFVFDRLPAGRFTLSATKPGYVPVFHGAKHAGRGPGIPVAVADGTRVDVTLRILPGGVITGTITDAHGQPARAIAVAAVEVRAGGGAAPVPARAVTDDRGVYRIFSLPPGAYAVSALPRLIPASEGRGASAGGGVVFEVSEAELKWARAGGRGPAPAEGRVVSYAPVFYPGTPDPSAAATVLVASGEERAAVDMALRIVAMSRITGKILDASGQPVSSATVSLFPRHTGRPAPVDVLVSSGALVLPRAVVSTTGFVINGVAPGEYTVVARSGSGGRQTVAAAQSGEPALWSVTDITIDGNDRTDVLLTLLPGLAVSGTLVFEKTTLAPPNDLSAVEVTFAASPVLPGVSAAPRAVVAPAGTFRFASVAPGRYLLRAEPPVGAGRWTLKSAMLGDRDLADRPVDSAPGGAELSGLVVTFTDNAAEVSGRLIDASGQPVTDYSIVVFTTDKTLWLPNARRVRSVRPATDGAFTVAGLPAGDYVIAAAADVEASDLADPAFLEQLLASAIPVTLREGEKKRQELRVGGR